MNKIEEYISVRISEYLARKYWQKLVKNIRKKDVSYAIVEVNSKNAYVVEKKYEVIYDIMRDFYNFKENYPFLKVAVVLLTLNLLWNRYGIDINIGHLWENDAVIEQEVALVEEESIVEIREESVEEETKKTEIFQEEVKGIKQRMIEEEFDGYLEEYSRSFHLDSKKVIEIARKVTNNYESNFRSIFTENVLNAYYIEEEINNYETFCLLFVYFLNREVNGIGGSVTFNLEETGYKREELITSFEMETLEFGEVIILENGQSRSQYIGKLANLLNMDKALALAISYSEAGLDSNVSDALKYCNNYGGMLAGDGSLMQFPTPSAGVISYMLNLKTYARYSLEETWKIYAVGGADWIKNVTYFYELIKNNPEEYFSSLRENELQEDFSFRRTV